MTTPSVSHENTPVRSGAVKSAARTPQGSRGHLRIHPRITIQSSLPSVEVLVSQPDETREQIPLYPSAGFDTNFAGREILPNHRCLDSPGLGEHPAASAGIPEVVVSRVSGALCDCHREDAQRPRRSILLHGQTFEVLNHPFPARSTASRRIKCLACDHKSGRAISPHLSCQTGR